MTFRPVPKAAEGQNFRSKATSGADGRARSTEPKGFKKPTKPMGRARDPRDRPEPLPADLVHAKLFPGHSVEFEDEEHVHSAEQIAALAKKPLTAAGFARATDLAAPAVAEHRRAADPDAPRTRAEVRDSALSKAWKAAGLALWFPGEIEDSEVEIPCPVSGANLRDGWHPHHIIEVKTLHNHGLAARVVSVVHPVTGEIVAAPAMYHPFLLMPVAPRVNLGFENGDAVIPRSVIPTWTWALATVLDELDPLSGPEWASQRLRSDYPEAS